MTFRNKFMMFVLYGMFLLATAIAKTSEACDSDINEDEDGEAIDLVEELKIDDDIREEIKDGIQRIDDNSREDGKVESETL